MLGSSRFFYSTSCKNAFLEARLHTEMGKMVHAKILGSFTQPSVWQLKSGVATSRLPSVGSSHLPLRSDIKTYFIGAHVEHRAFYEGRQRSRTSWSCLLFCALPRARHLPCSVSPALSTGYARAHVGSWAAVTQGRMPIGIMHCNYVAGPSRGLGCLLRSASHGISQPRMHCYAATYLRSVLF